MPTLNSALPLNPSTEFRVASPSEFVVIEGFYRAVGYAGKPEPTDRFVVASQLGNIVGACRLCTENGFYVLRGVEVSPSCQRQGIGTQMLNTLATLLGNEACWCLCRQHLDSFYGAIGFSSVPPENAPAFLQERSRRYALKHSDRLILCRAKHE